MDPRPLLQEADRCREMAATFADREESPFLLSVARAFDDLAAGRISASFHGSAASTQSDHNPHP